MDWHLGWLISWLALGGLILFAIWRYYVMSVRGGRRERREDRREARREDRP